MSLGPSADSDPTVKIFHDSVRKYCIDKAGILKKQWSTPQSDSFPRYCLLQKLLVEIERCSPADFKTFLEIKTKLAAVVEASEAAGLMPLPPAFRQSMLEEKNEFADFMGNLAEKDMKNAPDLFFRRVLDRNEEAGLWAELKSRSSFRELDDGFEVLVGNEGFDFDDYYITGNKKHENEISTEAIKGILQAQGVSRVWELREREGAGLPSVEIDVSALSSAPYLSVKHMRYLFSERKDWAICAHGDESLARYCVVGEWLIKGIEENRVK